MTTDSPIRMPVGAALPEDSRPFEHLSDTGVLWLINRVVFHPRGFALAIDVDAAGNAIGWTLLGDGEEPWVFGRPGADDENFAKVERFLNDHRPRPPVPDRRPWWRRAWQRITCRHERTVSISFLGSAAEATEQGYRFPWTADDIIHHLGSEDG